MLIIGSCQTGGHTERASAGANSCLLDHRHCCVYGPADPLALKAVFRQCDDGWTESTLTGSRVLQGYAGMMHGGIISLLVEAADEGKSA